MQEERFAELSASRTNEVQDLNVQLAYQTQLGEYMKS